MRFLYGYIRAPALTFHRLSQPTLTSLCQLNSAQLRPLIGALPSLFYTLGFLITKNIADHSRYSLQFHLSDWATPSMAAGFGLVDSIEEKRCQQGRPSPFAPINVHSYPKLYMCTKRYVHVLFHLLVSFVSGCTDCVSCFFLHHATAHTMIMMMMNYNYLFR